MSLRSSITIAKPRQEPGSGAKHHASSGAERGAGKGAEEGEEAGAPRHVRRGPTLQRSAATKPATKMTRPRCRRRQQVRGGPRRDRDQATLRAAFAGAVLISTAFFRNEISVEGPQSTEDRARAHAVGFQTLSRQLGPVSGRHELAHGEVKHRGNSLAAAETAERSPFPHRLPRPDQRPPDRGAPAISAPTIPPLTRAAAEQTRYSSWRSSPRSFFAGKPSAADGPGGGAKEEGAVTRGLVARLRPPDRGRSTITDGEPGDPSKAGVYLPGGSAGRQLDWMTGTRSSVFWDSGGGLVPASPGSAAHGLASRSSPPLGPSTRDGRLFRSRDARSISQSDWLRVGTPSMAR